MGVSDMPHLPHQLDIAYNNDIRHAMYRSQVAEIVSDNSGMTRDLAGIVSEFIDCSWIQEVRFPITYNSKPAIRRLCTPPFRFNYSGRFPYPNGLVYEERWCLRTRPVHNNHSCGCLIGLSCAYYLEMCCSNVRIYGRWHSFDTYFFDEYFFDKPRCKEEFKSYSLQYKPVPPIYPSAN